MWRTVSYHSDESVAAIGTSLAGRLARRSAPVTMSKHEEVFKFGTRRIACRRHKRAFSRSLRLFTCEREYGSQRESGRHLAFALAAAH
ncbi:hypothetical protein Q7C36_013922 [Tachysurus vachellii]|uniref:Uncharacterized protein n=1 Tax=Tachysurus vachellii TaxID=175792 RepID=A0AA88MJW9_TACVA|nr:hypothetical protein Q7C36_013922 [Tachysurus vachellii]